MENSKQLILTDYEMLESSPSPGVGVGVGAVVPVTKSSSSKPSRKRPRRLTKKKEEQRNKRVTEATDCLNAIIKFCLQKINPSPELSLVDYPLPVEEINHPELLDGKRYFKKNKVEGYLYSGHQFTEGLREWALKVDTGNFPFTLQLVREVRSCWKTPTSSPKRTCSCTREAGMTRTTWSLRIISQENSFFWSALTDYTLYQYAFLKDTERKELTTFKGTDILQQFMRLHPTLYSHLYAFFTMKQQASWIPHPVPQLPPAENPMSGMPGMYTPHPMTGGVPMHHIAGMHAMPHPPTAVHPSVVHTTTTTTQHTQHMHPPPPHMGGPPHVPHGGMNPGVNPRTMRPPEGPSQDVLKHILSPLQPANMYMSTPNVDQVLEDQKFTLMLVYKYYLKLAETENAIEAIEGLLEKMSYPSFVKCHVDNVCETGGRKPTPVSAKFDNYCWIAVNEQFVSFVGELAKKKVPRTSVMGKRAHSVELGLDKKAADQYALTDIECCKGPGYIHTTPLQKEGLLLHKIATPDKRLIFGIVAPNPQNSPSMSIYALHSPSPSPMATGTPSPTPSTAPSSAPYPEESCNDCGSLSSFDSTNMMGADEFNLLLEGIL